MPALQWESRRLRLPGIDLTLNSPRQHVIASRLQNHSRNHCAFARLGIVDYRPCWIKSHSRHARPDLHYTAQEAGSDPKKTCGFAAQRVFLRHTRRAGSLRQDSSLLEGVRRPRRRRRRASAEAPFGGPPRRVEGRLIGWVPRRAAWQRPGRRLPRPAPWGCRPVGASARARPAGPLRPRGSPARATAAPARPAVPARGPSASPRCAVRRRPRPGSPAGRSGAPSPRSPTHAVPCRGSWPTPSFSPVIMAAISARSSSLA